MTACFGSLVKAQPCAVVGLEKQQGGNERGSSW